jgi:hypothetical protein
MAEKIGIVRIERFDFRGRNVFVGMLGRGNEPIRMPLIDGLGEMESIRKESKTNIKIISPAVADYLMMGDSTFWGRVPEQSIAFWRGYAIGGFPTDVWIIYERENKPFGGTVEYDGHRRQGNMDKPPLKCNIPPAFQGQGTENTVLVQRGLKLEDLDVETMTLHLDPTCLTRIRNFPHGMAGMHSTDRETTVPSGRTYLDWEQQEWKADIDVKLRSRQTTFAEPYVGFVARFAAPDGVERQRICMGTSVFDDLSIVLEIPEKDLPKFR